MTQYRWFTQWVGRGRAWFDISNPAAHPFKVLSRRFLGAGLGLSIAFHLAVFGLILVSRSLKEATTVTLRLVPYAPPLIDLIPTPDLVTTEEGGGGGGGTPGGEPPPGEGHDLRSLGTPADLAAAVGVPVPVPDEAAGLQTTLATQDQLEQVNVVTTDQKPAEAIGMGGTGGGSGTGGVGGGPGSGGGGGGGDGAPGTWRYDTPPHPRRLITSVQPKALRNVEGTVKFRLLIDEFGTVVEAIITESSGHRELDALALEAVRKSTFNPATFRGRTVKAWITFGYGFKVAKR